MRTPGNSWISGDRRRAREALCVDQANMPANFVVLGEAMAAVRILEDRGHSLEHLGGGFIMSYKT
jgi:hypothetical protein